MRSDAATPVLREPAGAGAGLALIVFLGLAALCGAMLAVGELQALYVALALVACLAVLYDFRVGAVLLVVLMPFSASSVFPHELMGYRGLNPANLLVAGTLLAFVLHGGLARPGTILPLPLVLVYLPPILLAGFIGMHNVEDIATSMFEIGGGTLTPFGYFLVWVVKPLLFVAMAMLLAGAVARSRHPERFLVPIIASVWIVCLLAIVYVLVSGAGLAELASAEARGFYLPIGLHANDLGRLFLMAFALLLFTWWETTRPGMKTALLFTLAVVLTALVLSFSRAAYLGVLLVGALFLLWTFNARKLSFGLVVVVLALTAIPQSVVQRAMLGFDTGDIDAVSAGRWGLWVALLPEALRAPPWGNGIGSIMWSTALHTDAIEPTTHPHNAYLQALLDTGFLGLTLMLAFYAFVWRGFRRLAAHPQVHRELRGFFQGASAGLLAFLLTGWAGSSLMPAREWAFLWIAIGMMYGMQARRPAG
ncbi:MAG TPA: O-antigen ligase family protein [Burkholderiales bacterium]|nr:O-antigen ligase family protein [Burkholderiales bacterium]